MEARCLSCGYLLRGLAGNVCPECGRQFDPADPKTFDSRPPDWRRRRRIRRIVFLALLLLAGYGLVHNSRILDGKITFRCNNCGAEQIAYRWEVQSPRWLGGRIPGLHWRTGIRRPPNETRPDCCGHLFGNLALRFDFPVGSANATLSLLPTESPIVGGIDYNGATVNEQVTTPDNAVDVLRKLMSPDNFGVSVCSRPRDGK